MFVLVECVLGDFEADDDEPCLYESVEEHFVPGPEGGSLFGRIDHKHLCCVVVYDIIKQGHWLLSYGMADSCTLNYTIMINRIGWLFCSS